MFYSNKSSILVSGEGNSSRSKMISFMRILNFKRIVFLMCIVSSGEITWGMKNCNKEDKKWEIGFKKVNYEYNDADFEFSVVLLGDKQVGKTQILNQYKNHEFETSYVQSNGFDTQDFLYNCTNMKRYLTNSVKLYVFGLEGQPSSIETYKYYIKDSQAIVLVYDVTNAESFNKIKENWLDLAKGHAHKDAVYFLVGNKTDLGADRKVTKEEAQGFAVDNNMQFFEVSAKENNNLNKLFETITIECLENSLKKVNIAYNSNNYNIHNDIKTPNEKLTGDNIINDRKNQEDNDSDFCLIKDRGEAEEQSNGHNGIKEESHEDNIMNNLKNERIEIQIDLNNNIELNNEFIGNNKFMNDLKNERIEIQIDLNNNIELNNGIIGNNKFYECCCL